MKHYDTDDVAKALFMYRAPYLLVLVVVLVLYFYPPAMAMLEANILYFYGFIGFAIGLCCISMFYFFRLKKITGKWYWY